MPLNMITWLVATRKYGLKNSVGSGSSILLKLHGIRSLGTPRSEKPLSPICCFEKLQKHSTWDSWIILLEWFFHGFNTDGNSVASHIVELFVSEAANTQTSNIVGKSSILDVAGFQQISCLKCMKVIYSHSNYTYIKCMQLYKQITCRNKWEYSSVQVECYQEGIQGKCFIKVYID